MGEKLGKRQQAERNQTDRRRLHENPGELYSVWDSATPGKRGRKNWTRPWSPLLLKQVFKQGKVHVKEKYNNVDHDAIARDLSLVLLSFSGTW